MVSDFLLLSIIFFKDDIKAENVWNYVLPIRARCFMTSSSEKQSEMSTNIVYFKYIESVLSRMVGYSQFVT